MSEPTSVMSEPSAATPPMILTEGDLVHPAFGRILSIQPKDVTVVITHKGCTDGEGGSRMSAHFFFEQNYKDAEIQYFGAIPGEKFDWSEILELQNKNILFADVIPPPSILQKLTEGGNKYLILDHHKTNMEDLRDVPEENKVFDMNHSGTYLTWRYFFPEAAVPRIITLIEQRDLYQKVKEADQLSELLYLYDCNYDEFVKLLNEKALQEAINLSQVLELRKNHEVPWISKRANLVMHFPKNPHVASETNLLQRSLMQRINSKQPLISKENYLNAELVAYVNTDSYVSDVGNHLVETLPVDYADVWKYMGNYKTTPQSLRSTGTGSDVSAVAKRFRGGGHYSASGMEMKGLQYQLSTPNLNIDRRLVKAIWKGRSTMLRQIVQQCETNLFEELHLDELPAEDVHLAILKDVKEIKFHPAILEMLQHYHSHGLPKFFQNEQQLILLLFSGTNITPFLLKMANSEDAENIKKLKDLLDCYHIRASCTLVKDMEKIVNELLPELCDSVPLLSPSTSTMFKKIQQLEVHLLIVECWMNDKDWKIFNEDCIKSNEFPVYLNGRSKEQCDRNFQELQVSLQILDEYAPIRWNVNVSWSLAGRPPPQ
jgi:oligoribonuclease NrnB/cAMP/cGMP phosphodiesterase (DHH superfamily)